MEQAEHKLNFIATIALSSLTLCGDEVTCTGKEGIYHMLIINVDSTSLDIEKVVQLLSDKLKEYHQQIQTLEERYSD